MTNTISFDFIWTWGVIDHSANTLQIIKEMDRVLRPKGKAVTMVYHRGWWNYYFTGGIIKGIFLGSLFKNHSLHKAVQEYTDGAFSRYYTPHEWNCLVSPHFQVRQIRVYGAKAELFLIPNCTIKKILTKVTPNALCRFLTNNCRMGSFLVSILQRPYPGGLYES